MTRVYAFETSALFLIDGEETELDCTAGYHFYGAVRGMRDSCGGVRGAGPALEPDEPAHCEVSSILVGGIDMTDKLAPGEIEKLETEALEDHAEFNGPDPDAARERMMED